MRKLLIVISDEAGQLLDDYKQKEKHGNLDTALDILIKEVLRKVQKV